MCEHNCFSLTSDLLYPSCFEYFVLGVISLEINQDFKVFSSWGLGLTDRRAHWICRSAFLSNASSIFRKVSMNVSIELPSVPSLMLYCICVCYYAAIFLLGLLLWLGWVSVVWENKAECPLTQCLCSSTRCSASVILVPWLWTSQMTFRNFWFISVLMFLNSCLMSFLKLFLKSRS